MGQGTRGSKASDHRAAASSHLQDIFHGDVTERIVAFLPLQDVLRLEVTAARIVTKDVWTFLISTFEASIEGISNADNPTMPREDEDVDPKANYLNLVLNQKTSTGGNDMSICHFAPNGPYWHLIEDGDFGSCMHLQSVCWGDWSAFRELPPSVYDVVVRMKWDSQDFDRVDPMHFDCTVEMEGPQEPLLSIDLSDDTKEDFRRNVGRWINLNLGSIILSSRSRVNMHYRGVYDGWYSNWTVDWIGFFPSNIVPLCVSVARRHAHF
ncbi:hypothetical protein AeMF1_003127 [Aphanomyces euteiches]|nr:hypothetical protein AeMF1_003127 [Aphanomyces euteiches]KAH9191656.1 hypothetical protein AeNC1_006361 [Aphanomyces euteiches]